MTPPFEDRLKGHEELCLYRYGVIEARLMRIERFILGTLIAIVGQLLVITAGLLTLNLPLGGA